MRELHSMIILCFSFLIYCYLLYSSFTRNIYCNKNVAVAPVTVAEIMLCSLLTFPLLKMLNLYVFVTVGALLYICFAVCSWKLQVKPRGTVSAFTTRKEKRPSPTCCCFIVLEICRFFF